MTKSPSRAYEGKKVRTKARLPLSGPKDHCRLAGVRTELLVSILNTVHFDVLCHVLEMHPVGLQAKFWRIEALAR